MLVGTAVYKDSSGRGGRCGPGSSSSLSTPFGREASTELNESPDGPFLSFVEFGPAIGVETGLRAIWN
jgi:hypothetical protein